MLRTITFDCWDTLIYLVDPVATFRNRTDRVWKVLQRHGCEAPVEKLLAEVKEVWDHTLKQQYESGLDFPPQSQVQGLMERFQLKNDHETFQELYRAYTEALLDLPPRLMDGAVEVLEELKAGYRLGLICNTGATPGTVVRRVFGQFGIDRFFDTLIFSNEVGVAKPNPEIFKLALANLDTAPGDALHVGDDPVTDIGGGHRAGMKTAWFNHRNRTQSPPCDWRISSLREIPSLLKEV
ncbi:MAG: HAD family hydrolase [Firmicutes bacterium]|nr:HAD family hydrolase [Bacillota bacterium]